MRTLLLIAALGAAGYGTWHYTHKAEPTKGNELVRDRVWIDHLPRNEREPIQTFMVLKEQPVGLYNNASMWRGNYELFRYEMQGRQFRMEFPQTGDRESVKAEASRCDQGGMDFCLELDGGTRGVKRYFSREGWEIGSLDEGRAKIEALAHE